MRVITPGRYRAVLQADVKTPGHRGAIACGGNQTAAALQPGDVHELGIIAIPPGASDLIFTYERTGGEDIRSFWNLVLLKAESPTR